MLLMEPGHTQFDLKFNLFGFPVRVHPAFFLMPLILGSGFIQITSDTVNTGVAIIILELVFFLSILVHELGHAVAFRYFGQDCHIVLHWMGGLAIPGRGVGSWSSGRSRSLTPKSLIIVSLAGPFFGFALAGILALLVKAMGGELLVRQMMLVPTLIPIFNETGYAGNDVLWLFFFAGLWSNIFVNVFNLIPVFPLDGGQVARQAFLLADPWNGIRKAAMLGVIAGGAVAIFAFMNQQPFMGIMVAMMAFQSYQSISPYGGNNRPW